MPKQDYSPIVGLMCERHEIRIRKWRRSMSGCAWRAHYEDGRIINLIEAPMPKTPISLSIFLHEVGHHVIGFSRFRRRCEEEYHVWVWALREMKKFGVEPDDRVKKRFNLSMQYAVEKAIRRKIRSLPGYLVKFIGQNDKVPA